MNTLDKPSRCFSQPSSPATAAFHFDVLLLKETDNTLLLFSFLLVIWIDASLLPCFLRTRREIRCSSGAKQLTILLEKETLGSAAQQALYNIFKRCVLPT